MKWSHLAYPVVLVRLSWCCVGPSSRASDWAVVSFPVFHGTPGQFVRSQLGKTIENYPCQPILIQYWPITKRNCHNLCCHLVDFIPTISVAHLSNIPLTSSRDWHSWSSAAATASLLNTAILRFTNSSSRITLIVGRNSVGEKKSRYFLDRGRRRREDESKERRTSVCDLYFTISS